MKSKPLADFRCAAVGNLPTNRWLEPLKEESGIGSAILTLRGISGTVTGLGETATGSAGKQPARDNRVKRRSPLRRGTALSSPHRFPVPFPTFTLIFFSPKGYAARSGRKLTATSDALQSLTNGKVLLRSLQRLSRTVLW